MKVVEINVSGSDREPLILELRPGMTAGELVAEADLANYVLVRTSDPMNYLLPQEVLSDLLTDCETLIAKAPPTIDIDTAWEEMRQLVELNDDPPSEPMDTSEADVYIPNFFPEEGDL